VSALVNLRLKFPYDDLTMLARLLAVLLFPVVVWMLMMLQVVVVLGPAELIGLDTWLGAAFTVPAVLLMFAVSVFGAWKVCARLWRTRKDAEPMKSDGAPDATDDSV
jgi:hypothetical protein